ncbi:MAG: hypothetical protein LBK66_13420 [Spirochaetaceae bacterium]|jgi:hypothetical protein|nr:hypothetical protein [Spirochaetaceae bacterium]
MTGWDILDKAMNNFPPIVAALILLAVLGALVIFIVGFSRHGVNFVKYGFKQNVVNDIFEKLATKEDIKRLELSTKEDINRLELSTKEEINRLELSTKEDINRLDAKIEEVNRLGLSTKEDIKRLELSTKEDINRLDAKIEEINRFELSTKEDIKRLDVKIEEINRLELAAKEDINSLDAKIDVIETNHFGHLKNFLTELTSILLDKNIINNQDKARLDNKLSGM